MLFWGGHRESEKIPGNMFNLSHYYFHFYSAGLYWSWWNNCQGSAKKLLGQSGTYFDGNNLSAACHLCLYSWRNHCRIIMGNLLYRNRFASADWNRNIYRNWEFPLYFLSAGIKLLSRIACEYCAAETGWKFRREKSWLKQKGGSSSRPLRRRADEGL